MPDFGLTLTGLAPMTLEDIRAAINARVWALISPTLDLSDRSVEGQIIGIVSEFLASLWEHLERVYASQDPDKAMDAALDALCLLTGTERRPATKSVVTLTLTGDDATVVASGSGARVEDGPRFDTLEPGTLEALDAWAGTTPYAVDDRVTNDGNAYQCTTAGTSAGSGGPVGTDPLVEETDGTVEWRFLGEGDAAIDVTAAATEEGAKVANSGTVTEIVTPVGGWLGVVNVLDANVGTELMDNPSLRVLRELELAQPGTSPVDAIRAALLSIDDVTAATVFVNNTDSTNEDGMPPHSVEAMVTGGEDQDIWDTLLANVAAGILTHGEEEGTAEDSQGTEHVMKFSRPDEIPIYVEITIIKDPETYPEDGDDQIEEAIVTYGDAQATGKNAVASAVSAQAFGIAGVLEVVTCFIGVAPSPSTSTTIPISLREFASFDTSRVEVITSDGVP